MSTASILTNLLKNLMNDLAQAKAAAICDHEGLILASEGKENEDVLGAISALIDSSIERIKNEFQSTDNFSNVTTMGDMKFVFCTRGPKSILTIIANPSVSDTELKVYAEHVADKTERILEGNENVTVEIPNIIRVLSKTRSGKLPEGDYSVKLIITGSFQVGKTSLIKRYVENRFQESYISTIGVEISKKTLQLGDNTNVSFLLWDIGGQMQSMAPHRARFYNGANAAFIVLDRTRPDTLSEGVQMWYEDIKKSVPKQIPIIIIGNKSDLDNVSVSEGDIKTMAEKYGFHYILTSAKTGENVNDAFNYVGYKYLESI